MSRPTMLSRLVRWRGLNGDARGTAAVEFALIAPILVVIIIAVIDLGMAIHSTMRLSEATRIGAQFALGDADDTAGIQNAVLYATNLPAADVTPTVSAPFCECSGVAATCGSTCADGIGAAEYITVSAEIRFDSIMRYPWLDSPIILTESTTIRID